MKVCAVICRKAHVMLPYANFLSLVPIPFFPSTKSRFLCASRLRSPRFQAFRAQNRSFCALLGSGTAVFGHFEHKIGVFVRFRPSEPLFSCISSTKSAFLCAFRVWNPCFWALRAQNQGFCALLGSGTPVFGLFEHKNEDFVRFCQRDELNEQDEPNELNERDKQDKKNGRVSSVYKKRGWPMWSPSEVLHLCCRVAYSLPASLL